MRIIVNPHKLEIIKEEPVNEKEIDISKCYFEFSDEITNNYVKEAYFTLKGNTYKQIIINNECDYPSEVLKEKGDVELGVVAYLVENENEIKRYNPSPVYFNTWEGSLKDAENSQPITPSEMEQYEQALQDGLEEVNSKLEDIDTALIDVNTAIEETNNLDLDVSKEGKVATITLTKKDASTKVVTLSDGTSLMFNWDGTRLGVKTDEDSEYSYVDLQGIQGVPGPKGDAFQIKKTYSSVAEMNADFNNMELGDYVMIASTVEIEDNAKLYTRGESQWIFISDFSGAQGIKGETGATPNIQIGTVTSGDSPSVTRSGTDENPVLNFVLEKGEQGEQGIQGETGNGISSIEKTSTSGSVDTYTITFTNGNTTTFEVTNGEVTQAMLDESQAIQDEQIEKANMIYNALPRVNGSGTSVSLNNTAKCPMDIKLNASETSQNTDVITYTCVGTETGDYYFVYDNTNYQFTMPTITTGDVIYFNTTDLKLYLGTTEIATTTESTGTLITMNETPNPSYSQEVHTISGDNHIYVNKTKNLIPFTNQNFTTRGMNFYVKNGSLYLNGTNTGEISANRSGFKNNLYFTLDAGTYRLQKSLTQPRIIYIRDYYTGTSIKQLNLNTASTTFTLTKRTKVYLSIYFSSTAQTYTDYNTEIMLSLDEGSLQDYEPFKGYNLPLLLPVQNLAFTNWASDFVTRVGNTNRAKLETFDNRNCVWWSSTLGSQDYDAYYIFKINWKPNTQYTFSFDIYSGSASGNIMLSYTDGTTTEVSIFSNQWNKVIITSEENKTIKYLRARNNTGSSRIDIDTFMVEEGVGNNTFVPYGTTPIEVCKIGTYEDKFFKAIEGNSIYDSLDDTTKESLTSGKWYLEKNISNYTFNGEEGFTRTSGTGGYYFAWSGITTQPMNTFPQKTMCNYFGRATIGNSNTPNYTYWFAETGTGIRIKYTEHNTATDFKYWLSQNSTKVYYPAPTSTYILLNDTLQTQLENISKALSEQNQTNITQTNNDLPFVITASAIRDMSNIFNI